MQNFRKLFKIKERGVALFTVLVFIPILLLLLGSIIKATIAESSFLLREKRSEQAFYLAEAGLEMGKYLFSQHNFDAYTHGNPAKPLELNENVVMPSGNQFAINLPSYPGLSRETNTSSPYKDWIKWKWDMGDSYESLSGSSFHEAYYIKIYSAWNPADATTKQGDYIIEVVGELGEGGYNKRILFRGTRPNLLKYAIFDDGDLSEFLRGVDQTIKGWVHANGDLYMRPDGTTLRLENDPANSINCSITTAGRIIATTDAWGRSWANGTIYIDDNTGTAKQLIGGPGAFDSSHANWTDTTPANGKEGALERWGGTVRDGSLGATIIDPPPLQAFEPGGFYDSKAIANGLKIGPNGVLNYNNTTITTFLQNAVTTGAERAADGDANTLESFWNENEERQETVVDIDVEKLLNGPDGNRSTTGDTLWPANGIIYADTPIRLINAKQLPEDVTIVCPYNIYVKSDFNMVYPTRGDKNAGASKNVSAALCTTSRLFFLSNSWNDKREDRNGGTPGLPNPDTGKNQFAANDPAKYTGDADNVVEINAALVDGVPTVDEDYFRQDWGGVANPYYNDGSANGQWANVDDLLETWGDDRTLQKRGSIIHLQNCDMAAFNNSNVGPAVSAWIKGNNYDPPKRDYGPDPNLANAPPSFPQSSQRVSWQLVGAH